VLVPVTAVVTVGVTVIIVAFLPFVCVPVLLILTVALGGVIDRGSVIVLLSGGTGASNEPNVMLIELPTGAAVTESAATLVATVASADGAFFVLLFKLEALFACLFPSIATAEPPA
jgi:hypothetical protein